MDTEDSKLSRLLKNHDSSYIDDAGFTSRVMSALPVQNRSIKSRRRSLLLLSSCLLSIPLTLLLAGPEFLINLSKLIQILVEKPVLDSIGVDYGFVPLLCFATGLGISLVLAYRALRQALR